MLKGFEQLLSKTKLLFKDDGMGWKNEAMNIKI